MEERTSTRQKSGARTLFATAGQKWKDYWGQDRRILLDKSREWVFAFCGAFLLGCGALPYGAYPLGITFLACTSVRVLFAAAGVLLSALFTENLTAATVIATLTVLFVRLCMAYVGQSKSETRVTPFRESPIVRITLGAFGAGLMGFYRLLSGGFRVYDGRGALIALGCAVLFGFGFCCVQGALSFSHAVEVGRGLCVIAYLLALGRVELFGFHAAYVLACYATLYVALCYGGALGGVCGLLFGGVLSLSLAPAFAIAGLLLGLLRPLNLPLGLAWAGVGAGIYLLYTQDAFVFYSMVVNALLGGALLLLTWRRLPKHTAEQRASAQVVDTMRHEAMEQRFAALSDAFSSLSETFYSLSRTLHRPSLSAVRRACEGSLRNVCEGCERRSVCAAGKPCALLQTADSLSRYLLQKGQLTEGEPLEPLYTDCHRLQEVLHSVNLAYGRLLRQSVEENRTEIFAADYAALSKLLRHAGEAAQQEYEPDPARTRQACEEAQKMGLRAKALAVCGKRELQLCAVGVSEAQMGSGELHSRMERAVGVPLEKPTFTVRAQGETEMRMQRKAILRTEMAYACATKAGETVSGDVISSFYSQNGMFYTLLSDGMGSGAEAAVSANICRVFLEKMLTVGNSRAVSMEMLNELIRHKNAEQFATVDLLEIDLLCKNACFWKSGAAPSYVLRGGNLFKIAANTVPVGITRSLQAEEIRFSLEAGDVVLMISDGIAQSFEDSLWLLGIVSCEWEDSLQAMADKIMARAKARGGVQDDMTVALVRVSEN